MNEYYKKVTAFLEQYFEFPKPQAYTPNGVLSLPYIKIGIEKLLSEKIHISKKEIKQQALKDYNIILRDEFF